MPDFSIQIVNAKGEVEFEELVTEQEMLDEHKQGRCSMWCGYCYEEALQWRH